MKLAELRTVALCGMTILWLALVAGGFYCILQFETTPGESTSPPSHWPDLSCLARPHSRWNLVLAAHPRCPCTRATVDELAELLAEQPNAITTHALVYKPAHGEDEWEQTDICRRLAGIGGVQIQVDEDGLEAERFGLTTSGHILLYDVQGRLVFSGGLTEGRGRVGDHSGRSALAAILQGIVPDLPGTPVFGCPLFGKTEPCAERCLTCPR